MEWQNPQLIPLNGSEQNASGDCVSGSGYTLGFGCNDGTGNQSNGCINGFGNSGFDGPCRDGSVQAGRRCASGGMARNFCGSGSGQ